MAVIKLGPLVTGIRGTLGGAIFSANGSGPYVRAWQRPTNPRTNLQSVSRAELGEQALDWQNISSANKALWDTYAALPAQDLTNSLGETYSASGFNWFIRINRHLVSAGDPTRIIPPVIARPAQPTISSVQVRTLTDSRVFFPATEFPANQKVVLYLAGPFTIARQTATSPYYLMAVATPTSTTTYNFQSEFDDRYGAAQIGQVYFSYVQAQGAQGQRSSASAQSWEVIN